MGERDIDKYFKDKLKGYSKEVDTNAIWSALDMDKKRRKRPFFIWLSGLVIIAILAAAYFVVDKNYFDRELDQSIKETFVEKNKSSELLSDLAVSKSNAAQSDSENIPSLNSIKETQIRGNIVKQSTQNDIGVIQNKSVELLNVYATDSDYTSEMNQTVRSISKKNKEFVTLDIDSRKNNPFEILMNGSVHSSHPTTSSKLELPIALEIKYAQPFTIAERNAPESSLIERDLVSNDSNRGLRLNIYSGIFSVDRTLTTQNKDLEQFLSRKEKSESTLELISVGIQLRYDIGAVYFKGGIEFQSLNEKFEYEQYNVVDTVPTSGVIGILVDSDGNSFNQLGTVYEENSLTSKWTQYNSHRLFNIPISIGYEKGIGKWFFSIEAQSQLNFYHSYSGKRLDQQANVTDDTNDINRSFKLGLGAAVGLRYEYSNATSIYFSPSYFSYVDSFAHESQDYSDKYNLFGMHLGLSYKLF